MATDHPSTIKSILDAEISIPDDEIYTCRQDDEMADRCVWQVPTGDQESPGLYFHSSETDRKKTIKVRSRGPKNDPAQAYADALEIEDALQNTHPTGYRAVRLLNGPNFLLSDDDGRDEYSFNILCWIQE